MKEVDETPIEAESDESEDCERLAQLVQNEISILRAHALVCQKRIEALEKQVANLEAQKPPQDLSSDPEWFA